MKQTHATRTGRGHALLFKLALGLLVSRAGEDAGALCKLQTKNNYAPVLTAERTRLRCEITLSAIG
jgi:hypothetical protein